MHGVTNDDDAQTILRAVQCIAESAKANVCVCHDFATSSALASMGGPPSLAMPPTFVETPDIPTTLDELQTSLRPLAPAIRTVWTIKLALLTGLLTLAALVYDVVHLFQPSRTLPLGVVTGLVLLIGGALSFGLPRLRYRFWRFALHPEELYLERGIFNRVHTIVPLRRIQHLDVSQDLFEREYGLGKLIVHTAGTRSSDVVLPGLEYEEAERLRDAVKAYVLEDAF